MNMKTTTLTPELLRKLDAYWRAANYLSVGQIYLYDNPLRLRCSCPSFKTSATERPMTTCASFWGLPLIFETCLRADANMNHWYRRIGGL